MKYVDSESVEKLQIIQSVEIEEQTIVYSEIFGALISRQFLTR